MAIAVLPQRAGSPLTFRGIECKRGMQARSSMLPPNSQQLARWCLNASRRCTSVKAARNGQSGPSSSSDFNLAEYIEAKIENGMSSTMCLRPTHTCKKCETRLLPHGHDAMYVLLQLRTLISMATSSFLGSLMGRACTFLCTSVSATER